MDPRKRVRRRCNSNRTLTSPRDRYETQAASRIVRTSAHNGSVSRTSSTIWDVLVWTTVTLATALFLLGLCLALTIAWPA